MNQTTIEAIAARKKLVTLTMGAWRVTRLHKAETHAENARHGLAGDAKVLLRLCRHDALEEIYKLHAKAYSEHRRVTLPSVQDSMRIVGVGREFEHADIMRDIASEIDVQKHRFVMDYPALKATAPQRLNGLYDPDMFPDVDVVEQSFTFQTRYLACPTDGDWAAWLAESMQAAEDELAARLRGALERCVERCASDGKLYQTVFSNIGDLLSLVPDFDASGKYASIQSDLEALANVNAETLRANDAERSKVATQASSILDKWGSL